MSHITSGTILHLFTEHLTKLLGSLTLMLGTLQSLITLGAFDGLMSDTGIRWLAIACAMLTGGTGGATIARGVNNSTRERLAATAIKTQPPQESK